MYGHIYVYVCARCYYSCIMKKFWISSTPHVTWSPESKNLILGSMKMPAAAFILWE